ncbi:MAG: hypothetical protein Q4D32_09585 [Eubacteriales bacterium]|nr:hypothetical protein [Eubacteriales bacterium]
MGISTIGSLSQGMDYPGKVPDLNDQKIKQYGQTLERLQQNLKRTEKDAALSEEEKSRKRQEIQAEIAEVNRQKRQAELEAQREKMEGNQDTVQDQPEGEDDSQKVKISSAEEATPSQQDSQQDPQENLLSAGQMESVIIVDNALKQAESQSSTIQDLENRIRVLGGEIKVDQSRGGSASAKEAARDDLEMRVNQAREHTAKRLGDAKRKAEEKKDIEQQQKENYRFIKSQKDVALPNFQISI